MEKMSALLMRTCKGAARAFQASANLATKSNEKKIHFHCLDKPK
jgi:hypothetical protein